MRKLRKVLKMSQQEDVTPLQAISHKDLVAKYSLFKNSVGFQKGTIYHPCGATDVSPSEAFPDSRVIYADINDKSMLALRDTGYEAHIVDALTFNPGPVDVLILLNPAIQPDVPASFVKEGGYILSNDYVHHRTATMLRGLDCELIAIIHNTEKGLVFDRDHPEEYWQEIETDEEFKKAPLCIGVVTYDFAKKIVGMIIGEQENILKGYMYIIDKIQNQKLAGVSDVEDSISEINLTYKGKLLVLPTGIPRKKATGDDIFVFQKKPLQATGN